MSTLSHQGSLGDFGYRTVKVIIAKASEDRKSNIMKDESTVVSMATYNVLKSRFNDQERHFFEISVNGVFPQFTQGPALQDKLVDNIKKTIESNSMEVTTFLTE